MVSLEKLQNQVWDNTNSKYKLTKSGKKYVLTLEGTRVTMVLLSSLSREECESRLLKMGKLEGTKDS